MPQAASLYMAILILGYFRLRQIIPLLGVNAGRAGARLRTYSTLHTDLFPHIYLPRSRPHYN